MLSALLLLLGALLFRRVKVLGASLMLLSILSLLARPARGQSQACGGPFQWQVQSPSGTTATSGPALSLTPSTLGTYVVTLSDASETAPAATIQVVQCVTQADCPGNAGQCGFGAATAPPLCINGQCMDFAGQCCGAATVTAAVAGVTPCFGLPAGTDFYQCNGSAGTMGPCPGSQPLNQVSCNGAVYQVACTNDAGTGANADCIFGTLGDDPMLTGTNNADFIVGSAGNDTISALMGNDILLGDTGNDTLHGGKGNDCLYGGKNDDNLLGEDDNDVLSGDRDDDTLQGGAGDDVYLYNLTNMNSVGCNSDGTTSCFSATAPDGNDTIIETSGTDVLYLNNASRSSLCLARSGNDLLVNVCSGSTVEGSVRVQNSFAGSSNQVEQIAISGGP